MVWGGWIKGRKSGFEMGIPYVRVEAANHPFVKAVDDYLDYRSVFSRPYIFHDFNRYYLLCMGSVHLLSCENSNFETYLIEVDCLLSST